MDIELNCENCQKVFLRKRGEHNRNLKRGSKPYCSISCQAKAFFPLKLSQDKISNYDISRHATNRMDELSPFRYHLANARSHSKKSGREVSVTLEELKQLWEAQDGICPYTGLKMELKPSTQYKKRRVKTPYTASLDRIDSSKGYVQGNVQFVSYMANVAKNTFTVEEVVDFCCAVAAHKKGL